MRGKFGMNSKLRKNGILVIVILMGACVASLPAFADIWTVIPTPGSGGCYESQCTNYGGGDGSGGFITSLGPFSFSNPQSENSVPGSWATWNCPPATQSCTPNVLVNQGFNTLTITVSDHENTIGFELEPDNFAVETVQAVFHGTGGDFTLTLNVNGSGGALLFAVTDTTPGAVITSVDITDLAGGDFAIAQLHSGYCVPVPERGDLAMLFGFGVFNLAAVLGVRRRKLI